ncbi:hypothetical protein ASG92_20540 [Arthrobacter sp. Soil736]|uniref:hypothetical protein n=1 Tax=Arthrobacter sp. Soil736 TaxID=1736395 RepID=UPI0006F51FCA|nr:hypothetical protein [Arthrobacter sp. Soil736]KRE61777.1 hypothetical protein ASG92_20540 [Arthrobacter sp. Soil736]
MENSHNIQFSSLNESTHVSGKPRDGKAARWTHPLVSGMPVIDPVRFIEPSPDMADLSMTALQKKGRWS